MYPRERVLVDRYDLLAAIGVLESAGKKAVLLRSEIDDLDWFARELARLPWPFEIRKPAALARAITKHANLLLASVATGR